MIQTEKFPLDVILCVERKFSGFDFKLFGNVCLDPDIFSAIIFASFYLPCSHSYVSYVRLLSCLILPIPKLPIQRYPTHCLCMPTCLLYAIMDGREKTAAFTFLCAEISSRCAQSTLKASLTVLFRIYSKSLAFNRKTMRLSSRTRASKKWLKLYACFCVSFSLFRFPPTHTFTFSFSLSCI